MAEQTLEEILKANARDGRISCTQTWEICKTTGRSREVAGKLLNGMKIKVSDCQLGCFGVSKATHDELKGKSPEEAIKKEISGVLKEGKLPCAYAHNIAKRMKVTPREVGDTATLMSIKVSQCQLGCF
jgi:hypothetical protein